MRDLPSKTYYTAQRQRGHTHGRALRAVADRQLRILIARLTTRVRFLMSCGFIDTGKRLPEVAKVVAHADGRFSKPGLNLSPLERTLE
jgi:hypothetical protein